MTSTPVPEARRAVLPATAVPGGAEREELAAELPRLMALAYSVLRDRELASDAVQDTAEQALRSWQALREPSRRAAWLSTICVRQALRRARAERRQRLIRLRQPLEARGSLHVTDIDLERALRRLSVRQRAVVGLHYVYGYSLDDVAAAMGCRPGTARSHLNRALTALREHMEVVPNGLDV